MVTSQNSGNRVSEDLKFHNFAEKDAHRTLLQGCENNWIGPDDHHAKRNCSARVNVFLFGRLIFVGEQTVPETSSDQIPSDSEDSDSDDVISTKNEHHNTCKCS